jgi:hypothetical protein
MERGNSCSYTSINTLTCAGQVSVGADIFPYIRKLIPVFAGFAVYMDLRTDLLNHQSQHSGRANQTRRASDSGAEHCPPRVRPRRAKLPLSPLKTTSRQHHWIMSGLIDRQGRDIDLTSGFVIDVEILDCYSGSASSEDRAGRELHANTDAGTWPSVKMHSGCTLNGRSVAFRIVFHPDCQP